MFQIYTEANSGMRKFCTTHVENLFIERVHSYIFGYSLKYLDSGETK